MVALATLLRLAWIDLVEFKNDEAAALRLAEDVFKLGRIPLVGLPSSVGLLHPPHFLYLLVPVVGLSNRPEVGTAAIGLANVAGAAGLVWFGWRAFSPAAGLLAGVGLATHPWAVFYARKVWAPDLMAPWSVLFIIAVDRAVAAGSTWWAVAALPIAAIGTQIHFSFAVLVPLLVAPIWMLVKRGRWLHLLLGLGLAAMTSVPYLVHGRQTGWADLRQLLSRMGQPATVDVVGPSYVQGLATTWSNSFLAGVRLDQVTPQPVIVAAAALTSLVVLAGCAAALAIVFGPPVGGWRTRWRAGLVLLWLVLPAVLTIRHSIPMAEHYFLFVPPAAAMLIGIGVWLYARRLAALRRLVFGLGSSLVLAAGILHVAMIVDLLGYVGSHFDPEYGAPLARTEQLATAVAQRGQAAASQDVFIEFRTPESGATGYLLREEFPSIDVAQVGQIGFGARLAPRSAPVDGPSVLGSPLPLGLRYADGVSVDSAAMQTSWQRGEPVRLLVMWRYDARGPLATRSITWDISLQTQSGEQVRHQSGLQHAPDETPVERALVSWFPLETDNGLAPGRYQLRLRRLDDSAAPMPFVDASGQAGSEWQFSLPDLGVSGP